MIDNRSISERQSESSKYSNRQSHSKIYFILTIIFISTTVVTTSLAIVFGIKFSDYKKAMVGTQEVKLAIDVTFDAKYEGPRFDVDATDYGGPTISKYWYGKKLVDYLNNAKKSLPFRLVIIANMVTEINGVKNSNTDSNYWMIYSFGDSVGVGINDLYLTYANSFTFRYQHYSAIF